MTSDCKPTVSRTSSLELASKDRFAHIDAMRAFAVSLVVIAHTNIGNIPGGSGVTIFFTISGYVIASLVVREYCTTSRFEIWVFLRKRALKILPPLICVVLLPTIVYAVWRPISPGPVLLQMLFLFNWVSEITNGPIDILPGTSVVWSLAIEEQFYIVFALLWLLLVRRSSALRSLAIVSVLVVLTSFALRVILAISGGFEARISYGTDTRVEGIAIGVLLALGQHYESLRPQKRRTLKRVADSDCAIIGAAVLYVLSLVIRDDFFRETIRYSMQSLTAVLVIIYGFGVNESRVRNLFKFVIRLRAIKLLGVASYSIYLAHDPLMRGLRPMLVGLPLPVISTLLLVAGVSGGVLAWRLVEVPVLRYRMRV